MASYFNYCIILLSTLFNLRNLTVLLLVPIGDKINLIDKLNFLKVSITCITLANILKSYA